MPNQKDGTRPKILLLDIETSFKIAGVWGRFKQYVAMNQVLQDSFVLCWAAKWLDGKEVFCDSLHYHKHYKKNPSDDSKVLKSIWELMDEAEYIIAHNGARFDFPTLNARFIINGIGPPSTYKVIDTLSMARRAFKFTSNKLDDLAKALNVGQKIETDFDLWKEIVMHQNQKAFDHMVEYNKNDIIILEGVYKKLRGWDAKHPSTILLNDMEEPRCNVCGSLRVISNGSYCTNTNTYQKYKCSDCGHNMRSRKHEFLSKKQKKNILRST